MSKEEEEWVLIEDFPNYMVSSFGRIKNIKTNRILKPYFHSDGYKFIDLSNRELEFQKTKSVHRLVCFAFHPNPENKPEVNHKDGVRWNNHKDNVEWNTTSENQSHSFRTTTRSHVGKLNPNVKKVINTETGEVFDSVQLGAESIKMKPDYLTERLRGRTKNKTLFQYYIDEN